MIWNYLIIITWVIGFILGFIEPSFQSLAWAIPAAIAAGRALFLVRSNQAWFDS